MATPYPDDPSEDYNERSDARREVLKRLKTLIIDKLAENTVPPAFWGFCEAAEIPKLEDFIEKVEKVQTASPGSAEILLQAFLDPAEDHIQRWLQNLRINGSSTSNTHTSDRSTTAVSKCKERDNHKCVLTKFGEIEAAHIYPVCLLNATKRAPTRVTPFWHYLRMFWSEERVEKWQKATVRKDCSNLLSLAPHVHRMWGKGKFALKPVSKSLDGKSMRVQFFWQQSIGDGVTPIDLLTEPVSSRIDPPPEYQISVVTGPRTFEAIKSGDIFEISTRDPRELPLPSWDLLDMQWKLQRVAGMSGAAEVPDIYLDDDEEGEDNPKPSLPSDGLPKISLEESVMRWIYTWPGDFIKDNTPRLNITVPNSRFDN